MTILWRRAGALTLLLIGQLSFLPTATAAPPDKPPPKGGISVETSLTFPFVRIYMAQLAVEVFGRDRVLLGAAYQNWNNMGPGTAHAATLLAGYRFHFWKGAHVELEVFPAYNAMDSNKDGRRYTGWELWAEERIGYQFDLSIGSLRAYILPQPSIGHGIWLQHVWPGLSRSTLPKDSLIFVPQLIVGVQL